ncbi:unnamed protein product [Bursaphelenchus xylophilus]|uniref:(pine wood nematode) hypothetical protein n=1 Tax=Bursaphelenchus xylophilus TaxID=6326 RepID=A0A1I7RM98_BURXY|nr:unnamed protein product [Bursaphelenchus xylophilus]CAG9118324.1 unnamed protein product [Bursaphelenchus xylophilus]
MRVLCIVGIALCFLLLVQSAPPVERPKEEETDVKDKSAAPANDKDKAKVTTKKEEEPPNLVAPEKSGEKKATTKGVKGQTAADPALTSQGMSRGSTLSRALQSVATSGKENTEGDGQDKVAKIEDKKEVEEHKSKKTEEDANEDFRDRDEDIEGAGKGPSDKKKVEKLDVPKQIEADANKVIESPPNDEIVHGRHPQPPAYVSDEHGSSIFNYLIIFIVIGLIGYTYRKKIFTMVASSRRGGARRNVRYRKLSTGEGADD